MNKTIKILCASFVFTIVLTFFSSTALKAEPKEDKAATISDISQTENDIKDSLIIIKFYISTKKSVPSDSMDNLKLSLSKFSKSDFENMPDQHLSEIMGILNKIEEVFLNYQNMLLANSSDSSGEGKLLIRTWADVNFLKKNILFVFAKENVPQEKNSKPDEKCSKLKLCGK